jgi:hypothetical protein
MTEDLHLIDLASRARDAQHTWFRRNNNTISSRLDMILTNLSISNLKYSVKSTIFDHAWVQATFGQKKEHTNPTMRDYILGSEEFLIRYYDLLEGELQSCQPKAPNIAAAPTRLNPSPAAADETPRSPTLHSPTTTNSAPSISSPTLQPDPHIDDTEEDEDTSRNPRDSGLTAHNLSTGRTDLHFLNNLIKKVGTLHNEIDKSTRLRKEQSLLNKSKRQYYLHKEINKNSTPPALKEQHQAEYNDIQRELRMES